MLTYIWSLGAAPAEVTLPPAKSPTHEEHGILLLTAPEQAQSEQALTLRATLKDSQGKPIEGATIKFFVKVDFFVDGLMEIGETVTNDQGIAVSEYTPRLTGDIQILAIHQGESHEATTTVNLMESTEHSYQAEVGLQDSTRLSEVFMGPKSA